MASASTPSTNEPAKVLILVNIVQLKAMINRISQEEWYLNYAVFASVNSEKTCLKQLMIMIIIMMIMNKSQEMTVFSCH